MNVEIAQRLANMRREQGYSQEELAERLGLSRQAVSKWERAESSPDTGNLIALANLYHISIDELIRVEDDIEDDVKFEQQDKSTSAETQAQEAAVRANEAAVRAAQAAVAAAQARATAQKAQDPVAAPAPSVAAAMPQQPQQQPTYGVPAQPHAPYATQAQTQHDPYRQDPYAASAQDDRRTRGPWSTFPYPILCVVAYLVLGFFFGAWHPGWIIFLTIPLYYWIANIIEHDPNYRANRR